MKIRSQILAAVLLVMVLSGIFFPVLFQGKTFLPVDEYNMLYQPFAAEHPTFAPFNHFEDDILKWYYEWKFYARKHLYKPYWSPNAFGGVPWYGNTYASHFCSSNWILTLGPLNKTFPIQLIVQLWIAGFGMFLLLRSLDLGFGVSFLYSTAFMLSSMFITLLLRWWMLGAFSWVPYLLWALRYFWDRGRPKYFALSALFLALSFLDGFLQADAFVLIIFGSFSLCWWYWMARQWSFGKMILSGVGILFLAAALSSVMWFPTLEYFIQDLARGSSRASGTVFGKNLQQRLLSVPFLVSFMMPQLLGSVRALDIAKLINTHLQDFTAYIGSAPLLFGLCGLFDFRNRDNRMKPFLALVLGGLFIPIFTPFDRYFYFRFLMVYTTGICILGALSLDKYLKEPIASRMYVRIQNSFFAFFGLIFLGVVALDALFSLKGKWLQEKLSEYVAANFDKSTIGSRNHEWMLARVGKTFEHFSLFSPTMFLPFLTALVVFLALLFYRKGRFPKSYFLGVLVASTIVELSFFTKSWLPINDEKIFPLFPKNYVSDFLLENAKDYRATVNDFTGGAKQKQIIPTNSQVIFGYKSLEGFDGLIPPVIYFVPAPLDDFKKLGLLNVKYILTHPEPRLTDPALTLVKTGIVSVYENKYAKPRGRILYKYEVIPPNLVRERMAAQNYDGNSVFFSQDPPVKINEELAPQENVSIVSESDNDISYKFTSEKAGYFVASETNYPGWKAWLDGKPAEILKANYAMRAVVVPQGEHELRFVFDPDVYKLGLSISVIGFLFFLGLFFGGEALSNQKISNS